MTEAGYDVFVSYASADEAFAERVARAVEADRSGPPLRAFYAPWVIGPGADIAASLESGLQRSRFVALVISPEALGSPWVRQERFTAIWRDPAASRASLIPLLRRDSEVPDLLGRLRHIDFRADSDFAAGMAELIAAVRGRPVRRDGEMAPADFDLRDAAALLRRQRIVFERPAFQMPCVWELRLSELIAAIDDTMAALNTGALYSRSGNLLSRFNPRSSYRLKRFREAFGRVVVSLGKLKRMVVDFGESYEDANPRYRRSEDFYAMLTALVSVPAPNAAVIADAVDRMDAIDSARNDILREVNRLLRSIGDPELDLIGLSSDAIRSTTSGFDAEVVAALERPDRQ
ncbi:hypothetical protein BBK82_43040 [Lentzea guizhouensis]|uniref:TIR domain-containing protein n=1 Tax=Lentzea guizhouensis TaxID=1586287 RepID=A0A1B2HVI9_9PSEU|nr:toll/interleukin-1 receptor domain-containing protein [Lentzea guizhouensis]ANZ41723.1 hypothetical protein BBK82_43040 [Lentzea guizhouensis]